jgi:hypothetical protein
MRANGSKATKTRRGTRPPLTSKVVFLTGAGASVPLGLPDTKHFLEDFFQRDARELSARSPELAEYLRQLFVESLQGEWDVETMMDVLLGDRTAADRLMARPGFVQRVLNGYRLAPGPFVADTDAILELLRDNLVRQYSRVDATQAADLYRPILQDYPKWFSDIPNLGRTLVMFTLNYDLAVETAARALQGRNPDYPDDLPVKLVDGLADEDGLIGRRWSPRAFRDYRAVRGRANTVLVKLHGSVRWGRSAGEPGAIVELPVGVRRDPAPYDTLVLYPTAGPKPIQQEPFHTGYRLLASCLGHTRLLVAIGTSFRDSELCLLIRDAMEDNPFLRLAAVGPHQSYRNVAERLGVDGARVAALKTEFAFPTHSKYDAPARPTYNSVMGGVGNLASIAYAVKTYPGGPRFGMTSEVNADGLWREDRAES